MPLCTVALPVSNLPQSTSFFLSALHPLGYRYLSQRGDNQIGFGVDEPDFFLYQERPGYVSVAALYQPRLENLEPRNRRNMRLSVNASFHLYGL